MLTSLRNVVLTTLALWLIVGGTFGASPASARQSEDEEAEVTHTVIDLLRLEGEGDLDRLYDAMAPESRGIIPRQAFVNWYSDEDWMVPADEPEIESITFDDWVSDATGDEYEDVAFVEYSVEVEAGRDEDIRSSEMILWNDGQVWR